MRRIALAALLAFAPQEEADDLASLLPFAKSWKAAAARAQEQHKLILAIVQIYPGLAIPADAAVSAFLERELLDLVNERFVPLHVTRPFAVPFAAADRYGMGPHCFGASALVVTPDGEVVADTFVVGGATQWLDEFLRGVLAERGEDEFDALALPDPIERAEALARRGELDEAMHVARTIESLRACLLRTRIQRRLRAGAAAKAELAAAAALVEQEQSSPEVRAEVEIERALVAAGTGDVAAAKAAFHFALVAAPDGPRVPEVKSQLATLAWCEQDYATARQLFDDLERDHPDSIWARAGAGGLTDAQLDVGGAIDPRWPATALFDALTLAPPAPVKREEAASAADGAVQRLLADQQPEGAWIVGTDAALAQIERPDALRLAVTAIVAQSLLPERADPQVAAALQRALPWLLAQAARARAKPPPRESMDYWPWAHAYLVWFLADAVKSGFVPLATLGDEPARLFADLKARQQKNGGWSYLVSVDPSQLDSPLAISMSFTTGAAVAALQAASAAGLAVTPDLYEPALAAIEKAALKGGTFLYAVQADAPPQPPQWTGAAGRDAFLAHLLDRGGRGRPGWVAKALDRFGEHLHELAREQGKTLMHCGPEALGSHYVFFDYVNTARVLAESEEGASEPETRARRAQLRGELLDRVLAARLADGSFVDNPLLGRAYGTAMALQAIRFLRAP